MISTVHFAFGFLRLYLATQHQNTHEENIKQLDDTTEEPSSGQLQKRNLQRCRTITPINQAKRTSPAHTEPADCILLLIHL